MYLNRKTLFFAAASAIGSLMVRIDGGQPTRYPDPAFWCWILHSASIVWAMHPSTGITSPDMLWAEGPAWNGVGKYLIWSDIPNDRQLRWIQDDGQVNDSENPAETVMETH